MRSRPRALRSAGVITISLGILAGPSLVTAAATTAPSATVTSSTSSPARVITGDVVAAGDFGSNAWRKIRLDVETTTVGATSIAWASVGSPTSSDRPLVMLNGTGSPMAEWDPALLAALAKTREVIVFDYPGLGESGANPGPTTFRSIADTTAAFLTQLGLTSVDLLGWSMGGFITQELLRAHPQLVHRAVLAGTNPGGKKAKLGPKWVQEADSDPSGAIKTYLQTNYPETRSAQRKGKAFIKRLNKSVNSGRYPDESVPAKTYRRMVRAENPWLRSNQNFRELKQVSQHVLVMTGREDVITPPTNSRRIAKRLPHAKLKLFAGSGHSFLFQKPKRVAKRIDRFLK